MTLPDLQREPLEAFRFYLERERQASDSTLKQYSYWIVLWMQWTGERGLSIFGASPRDVRAFSTSGEHWARKTRSQLLSALKAFYRWAEMEELVLRSPARSIPHPRLMRTIPKHYDAEEARRLLGVAVDLEDQLILRLGLHAGLRPGEARGLLPADVGLTKGRINVRRSGPDAPATKSLRERQVPIHDDLRPWLSAGVEADQFMTLTTGNGHRNRFKHLCRRADVPYHGPHALRRTFATRLARLGVRDGIIRLLLGHAPRVEDSYIAVGEEDVRDAIEGLDY